MPAPAVATDVMNKSTVKQQPEQLISTIVEAVADATDADPVTMNPPLYEVIDLEAVDKLIGGEGILRVEFQYRGHSVSLWPDGTVAVDGTAQEVVTEVR